MKAAGVVQDPEDMWVILYSASNDEYSAGDYAAGAGLAEAALWLAQSAFDDSDDRLLLSLENALYPRLHAIMMMASQKQFTEVATHMTNMQRLLQQIVRSELHDNTVDGVRRIILNSWDGLENIAMSLGIKESANKEIIELCATIILGVRSIRTDDDYFLTRVMRSSVDPQVKILESQIAKLRSMLSREFYTAASRSDLVVEWSQQLRQLQEQLNQTEVDISRALNIFRLANDTPYFTVKDVQEKLSNRAAFIEIVQYSITDFAKPNERDIRYGAMFIDRENIEIVDLAGGLELVVRVSDFYKLDAWWSNEARAHLFAMYNYFLGHFAEELKGLDILYISSVDFIGRVPFGSLQSGNGEYLVEQVDVRPVQSSRDLLERSSDQHRIGLVALGDIDFDRRKAHASSLQSNNRAAGVVFTPLDKSGEEARAIAERYRTSRPQEAEAVEFWHGASATEDRLRAVSPPPRVLHLATHGFYHEEGAFSAIYYALGVRNPMLLAGVSLAGANEASTNGENDGVLYAIEAQSLNLEGTELVVLSACETAQGVVDYHEGVYGLVRAFRTAGARKVMVAFRAVDDASTRDFMIRFYEHWLDQPRSDPAAALRATQLEYIKAGWPPHVWAPYVLLGAS